MRSERYTGARKAYLLAVFILEFALWMRGFWPWDSDLIQIAAVVPLALILTRFSFVELAALLATLGELTARTAMRATAALYGQKVEPVSNSGQPTRKRVSPIPVLIFFLAAGWLVTFGALLGGVVLATIAGTIIGLFTGLMSGKRSMKIVSTISGATAGALATLYFEMVGGGMAGQIVGPVIFVAAGYIFLIVTAAVLEL